MNRAKGIHVRESVESSSVDNIVSSRTESNSVNNYSHQISWTLIQTMRVAELFSSSLTSSVVNLWNSVVFSVRRTQLFLLLFSLRIEIIDLVFEVLMILEEKTLLFFINKPESTNDDDDSFVRTSENALRNMDRIYSF